MSSVIISFGIGPVITSCPIYVVALVNFVVEIVATEKSSGQMMSVQVVRQDVTPMIPIVFPMGNSTQIVPLGKQQWLN